MISYLDLHGASGAAYRFARTENATPPTAHSGLYLYVRENAGDPPVVLFLDQTENLMTGATGRWAEAVRDHGATALFTRLHVGATARKAELVDILSVAVPVMNPPFEAPAASQAPVQAQASEMDLPPPPSR